MISLNRRLSEAIAYPHPKAFDCRLSYIIGQHSSGTYHVTSTKPGLELNTGSPVHTLDQRQHCHRFQTFVDCTTYMVSFIVRPLLN